MFARRRLLQLTGAVAATAAAPRVAIADTYPSRPLRFIVPFPAGGSADLIARLLGEWLAARLGQPVIIENKPGGGTNIAMQAAVNAAPDGYTLAMILATNAINPSLYKSLPFDFQRDIAGRRTCRAAAGHRGHAVAAGENRAGVHRLRQSQSRKDQFRLVRRPHHQPSRHRAVQDIGRHRRRTCAVSGWSADADRSFERPRPGRDRCTAELATAYQSRRRAGAGGAVGEAHAGASRRADHGRDHRGLRGDALDRLGVPSGTPSTIIERLNAEINAGLNDPGIRARMAEVGGAPLVYTPAALRALIASDVAKWATVVERAGIAPE